MRGRIVVILIALSITLLAQTGFDAVQAAHRACYTILSGFPKDPDTVSPPPYPSPLSGVTLVFFESGCYGNCPSFTMTIRSSGVEFEGHAYVKVKGKRKAKIDSKTLDRFVHAWFDHKMYAMRDDYCMAHCPDGRVLFSTDVQASTIELSTPEFTKKVYECYHTINREPDAPKPPQQYYDLKAELSAFAKSKGWI